MVSAVFGVRAVTIGMPRLMTLCTGLSLQHIFHLGLSHQVFFDQTGNAQTASRWYHGRVAGSWCGINTGTLKADDMRTILANHEDFVNEKTQVEHYVNNRGLQCFFLPKFHCELNPIERVGPVEAVLPCTH